LIYQLQRLPADTVFTNSTTDRVCWCKVTHYTANGGTQCSFVPTAWVWFTREGEYSVNTQEGQRCVSTCANECAERVSRNSTHFLEQFFPFLFAQ